MLIEHISPKLRVLKVLVIDVDRILTDGTVYFSAEGICAKRFFAHDVDAMKLIEKKGIRLCIINTSDDEPTRKWIKNLPFCEYYTNVSNKYTLLKSLSNEWVLPMKEMSFISSNIKDLECMSSVGISVCSADAPKEVISTATLTSSKNSGHGVVEEFCSIILNALAT
jgi:3-deoxy-D-manno-octulosonate 8-phosphate phosphatase (KDO 8-P phosphatase)